MADSPDPSVEHPTPTRTGRDDHSTNTVQAAAAFERHRARDLSGPVGRDGLEVTPDDWRDLA